MCEVHFSLEHVLGDVGNVEGKASPTGVGRHTLRINGSVPLLGTYELFKASVRTDSAEGIFVDQFSFDERVELGRAIVVPVRHFLSHLLLKRVSLLQIVIRWHFAPCAVQLSRDHLVVLVNSVDGPLSKLHVERNWPQLSLLHLTQRPLLLCQYINQLTEHLLVLGFGFTLLHLADTRLDFYDVVPQFVVV